jgi:hypothetical protein
VQLDLPVHLDAESAGPVEWKREHLSGGAGLEDGFDFVQDAEKAAADPSRPLRLAARRTGHAMNAWLLASGDHEWWRAVGPGPPGRPHTRFHLVRSRGSSGAIRSVLDWRGDVRDVRFDTGIIEVTCADGAVHRHSSRDDGWWVEVDRPTSKRSIHLAGLSTRTTSTSKAEVRSVPPPPVHGVPPGSGRIGSSTGQALIFALGEPHFRRSEASWREAGSPTASIRLEALRDRLHIEVDVRKEGAPAFAPARERNDLDNEHPDTNSDGLQLYLAGRGADRRSSAWLIVPEAGGNAVRITSRSTGGLPIAIEATWSATTSGYLVRCAIELPDAFARDGFAMDLIVNEISADRARRRGQLVLSGAAGEWTYLRGDRQDRDRFLDFVLESDAD